MILAWYIFVTMNSDKQILYVSRTQEYKSRIFATTTAEVYRLETDNENHRNIIYTDYSALKTTDGQGITTIAGNWGIKRVSVMWLFLQQ